LTFQFDIRKLDLISSYQEKKVKPCDQKTDLTSKFEKVNIKKSLI